MKSAHEYQSFNAEVGEKTPTWICVGILLALLLAGGLLRGLPVSGRTMHTDEAHTWDHAVHVSYRDFVRWSHHYHHPPLYYLLTRVVVDISGSKEPWALRYTAVIAGILCIPAGFMLGQSILGRRMGLLVAALVAFDPYLVDQSQQARMHILLTLFVLLALAWLIRLIRAPGQRPWQWVGLGLILGLQLWSTQAAAVVWIGLTAGVSGWLVVDAMRRRSGAKAGVIVSGFALALLTAALMAHMGLLKLAFDVVQGGPNEAGKPAAAAVASALWACRDLVGLGWMSWLVFALAAVGLIVLWRHGEAGPVILVMMVALVTFVSVAVFASQRYEGAYPRYVAAVQPALWVGLATLPLLAVGRRVRGATILLIVVLLTVQVWHCMDLSQWWSDPRRYEVAPRIVAVGRQLQPGDVVIYSPGSLSTFGRYLGVPADRSVELSIWDYNDVRPDARLPEQFDAPATWVIDQVGPAPIHRTQLLQVLRLVAQHYGQAVDEAEVDRQWAMPVAFVARIDVDGIVYGIER